MINLIKQYDLGTFLYKLLLAVIAAIFSYLMPVFPLMIAVGIVIFVDTAFGIWAVKKTEPEKFSSNALRKGLVTKLFFYQLVVVGIFLIDKLILHEFSAMFSDMPYIVTKLVAVALVMIEAVSIDEKFFVVYKKHIIQGVKDFINSYNTIKNEFKNDSKDKG